ncbi:MAG: hypothetical protein U0Z44_18040 [Kouleothrix sp.]
MPPANVPFTREHRHEDCAGSSSAGASRWSELSSRYTAIVREFLATPVAARTVG